MRDKIIVEKIKDAVEIMNEIDEMIEEQPLQIQSVDLELSDFYHLIENNELNEKQSYVVTKRIHELRKLRRSLNNEHEIETTYLTHKSKMAGNETRQFLMNEVYKTEKKLKSEYNNRILTDEQIKEILEETVVKRKPGRPKKVDKCS